MKLTYYGHSCFLLETESVKILFDPFISPNELANDIDINSIEVDYILVSHGHEDHVADVLSIGQRCDATVVSNFEIVSWFQNKGIKKGHPMNFGGSWSFDFGTVKYVQAVHSSVMPDGAYGGNPGGFILTIEGKTIYFAGDTALFGDMQLFAKNRTIDLALLPIGDNFTMGVDDAIEAAKFVNCAKVIGMHYDTFGFIVIDKEEAKKKFEAAGIDLTLMPIGTATNL